MLTPPFLSGDAHKYFVPESASRPVILSSPAFVQETEFTVKSQCPSIVLKQVEVDLMIAKYGESIIKKDLASLRSVSTAEIVAITDQYTERCRATGYILIVF